MLLDPGAPKPLVWTTLPLSSLKAAAAAAAHAAAHAATIRFFF